MTYDRYVNGEPAAEGASEGTLFEQVRREPRLSDKVAEMMLDTILSRRLAVGDRLPSERELGEQFGVSRTVVREAVRALVAKGVIEVRSGSGLRVAAVDAAAVSESMSLFMHGGRIEAQSEGLGKGSAFEIRLPLAPAGGPAPAAPPRPAHRPRRVLVVDDNRDAAGSLAAVLRHEGNDTRVAYDGASALESAESFDPEVVLLDIAPAGVRGVPSLVNARAKGVNEDAVSR